MKNTLYFVLLIITLQACKKEVHTDPDVKLHPITFNVSNLTQQTGPITKTSVMSVPTQPYVPTLKGGINRLDYLLYDASGNLKKHLIFQSSQANFGTITDNVGAGNYSVAIVGSIDSIGYTAISGGIGFSRYLTVNDLFDRSRDSIFNYVNVVNFQDEYWSPWYDTFFKKININVSNSNVSQSVTLNRIVAQVELNLLDALPNDATSVKFTINGERQSYSAVKDALAGPVSNGAPFVSTPITNTNRLNFKANLIVINTGSPITAIVEVTGAGGLITKKTINNILCQKNTKTILSGKLSGNGNSPNNGFQINVKTGFDPDTIKGTF